MTSLPKAWGELQPALQQLDVLLYREIVRMRAAHLLATDDLRGLYVSDAQVDALLRQAQNDPGQSLPDVAALTAEAERLRVESVSRTLPDLPLSRSAALFGLDEFERDVLLLAVAPELDLRYEVLYSYLNNDVTRKQPTCDLALRLFCAAEERWERRRYSTPEAALFRNGLIQWLPENPDAPASSLARSFHAPLRIVDFLLGVLSAERKLAAFAQLHEPRQYWEESMLPEAFIADLRAAICLITDPFPAILVFEGGTGAGKRSCAAAFCAEMGRSMLRVEVPANNGVPDWPG